ncbi:hypothetical protein T4B_1577 [Trichinella pseudospiralis]|uniref:Uncharacterized protein n=1 Tax=Trichinella pseudospiralis TaxID=6337 RepID=A0A0V1H0G1_TRIPS|nr:hypothetical protein T4B_1577 [Trichinella pseudospiralis]KRZ04094.1 hypothetical protein T4C_5146 [Trichinella pseudospiralis]
MCINISNANLKGNLFYNHWLELSPDYNKVIHSVSDSIFPQI